MFNQHSHRDRRTYLFSSFGSFLIDAVTVKKVQVELTRRVSSICKYVPEKTSLASTFANCVATYVDELKDSMRGRFMQVGAGHSADSDGAR